MHFVGKLRHDANLRYLYEGKQKPRGRRRLYDGKIRFDDLSRFEIVRQQGNQTIYTGIVDSVCLKRNVRIVYIVQELGNKILTALLFSTDIDLHALEIYRYYKARFQIEFDAKQFTGLSDCQARGKESLHFYFNASMTALNLIKMEDRQHAQTSESHVTSIATWKMCKFNEYLLKRFSSMLALDFNAIKSLDAYEEIRNYGAIAT